MRSVSVVVALWLLVAAARGAPGGDKQSARLMFGGSSTEQKAAPRTVTRLVMRREWVTRTTPSSCVVVQTSLPACRNLRHLGAAINPSVTVSRIEPTKAATLDEVEGGAEGRTFGWFRGSSTEAAPAHQVVSGPTPALVLQDSVLGGETVVVEERRPALRRTQLVVAQEQPTAERTLVVAAPAQPRPAVTHTLLLEEAARPAAAHAQHFVLAAPEDDGGAFLVEQAPQTHYQQVVIAGAGEQPAVQGATILLEGAEPQQTVVTVQKGEKPHRYTWGEWLGLSSPAEAAPAAVSGGAGADGVVTVRGTLLHTATRAHIDRDHVVTFSVTGCEPTRLPFDLDYCEGHRPSKGAVSKGSSSKNVITIQEVDAE